MSLSRASHLNRPLRIAVICDVNMHYGRDITLGVTKYANLQRKWELYTTVSQLSDIEHIPLWDGLIIAGIEPEMLKRVLAEPCPTIHCSGAGDPLRCHLVSMDDVAVGALAAEHLLGCQLEHFAYYGWREPGFDTNRFDGFKLFLQQHGYDAAACPVARPSHVSRLSHGHHDELARWVQSLPKPVGILAVDDTMANDLVTACFSARIEVPEQVAIIGVNDDPLMCESAWPPISSVRCEYSRVGYRAAQRLEQLLEGDGREEVDRWLKLPPVGVTARQSTSVLAVSQPEVAASINFIREHACDPCHVSDVLKAVPVSRRWLEKQFKLHLGRTPHAEIMRWRMATARRLMLESDLPLSNIASRCGFASVQNFTRAFRDAMGTTPGVFRRQRTKSAG